MHAHLTLRRELHFLLHFSTSIQSRPLRIYGYRWGCRKWSRFTALQKWRHRRQTRGRLTDCVTEGRRDGGGGGGEAGLPGIAPIFRSGAPGILARGRSQWRDLLLGGYDHACPRSFFTARDGRGTITNSPSIKLLIIVQRNSAASVHEPPPRTIAVDRTISVYNKSERAGENWHWEPPEAKAAQATANHSWHERYRHSRRQTFLSSPPHKWHLENSRFVPPCSIHPSIHLPSTPKSKLLRPQLN